MGVENSATASLSRRDQLFVGLGLLLAIAFVGLYIVKWNPYYHRALSVAASHSLGSSIISGDAPAPPAPSLEAAVGYGLAYFKAVWQALVLGLLLAATIEAVVPQDWLLRVLGSPSFQNTILGSVLALPGMMCTCCVSPVVVGLRRSGASTGAAMAFFLGNPTLNPAVLVFMLLALSWKWALLRLAAGLILVLGVSWLVVRLAENNPTLEAPAPEPRVRHAEGSPLARWLRALGRLAVGLIPEYIVIVLALGAARAWLFPTVVPGIGNSLGWIVGLALAGTLFVIPTAGEIPVIQTMMKFGLGAGPAGALLMTLAPVSLPSLVMIGRAFPARVLVVVAIAVAVIGIVTGLVAMTLGP